MNKISEIVSLAANQIGKDYTTFCKDMGYNFRIEWCACFISWLATKCGITDIIPVDMSCNSQIRKFKNLGCYNGTSGTPKVGDIIYYDWCPWESNPDADHVGIVESVNGCYVTVIEGNNGETPNDRVRRRTISYLSNLIYGWATPNYNKYGETDIPQNNTEIPFNQEDFDSQKGESPKIIWDNKYDEKIAELQRMLNKANNAGLVVDGIVGNRTYTAVKRYTVELFDAGPLIKWVQERLNSMGFECGEADGYAEQETMQGIEKFQNNYGLGVGYLGGSDWYYILR